MSDHCTIYEKLWDAHHGTLRGNETSLLHIAPRDRERLLTGRGKIAELLDHAAAECAADAKPEDRKSWLGRLHRVAETLEARQ